MLYSESWRYRLLSTFSRVAVCRLMAPSHYLHTVIKCCTGVVCTYKLMLIHHRRQAVMMTTSVRDDRRADTIADSSNLKTRPQVLHWSNIWQHRTKTRHHYTWTTSNLIYASPKRGRNLKVRIWIPSLPLGIATGLSGPRAWCFRAVSCVILLQSFSSTLIFTPQ